MPHQSPSQFTNTTFTGAIHFIHPFSLTLNALRIRFSLLQIQLRWRRRRGGSGTSNHRRRTRSALTAPRRTRSGPPFRTASSCVWSAPASTVAWAFTSPSSDLSPWTPGPKSRSRKWKLAATISSTPSSLSTPSPRRQTSSLNTTPTPPPSTATGSRPSPTAVHGAIRR